MGILNCSECMSRDTEKQDELETDKNKPNSKNDDEYGTIGNLLPIEEDSKKMSSQKFYENSKNTNSNDNNINPENHYDANIQNAAQLNIINNNDQNIYQEENPDENNNNEEHYEEYEEGQYEEGEQYEDGEYEEGQYEEGEYEVDYREIFDIAEFKNVYTNNVEEPVNPDKGGESGTGKDIDRKTPKTGDESNFGLWAAIVLMSGATLAATTVTFKKKHNK